MTTTFKHSKKWYFWASIIVHIFAVMFAALPAIVATVVQFPVWVTKDSNSTVSFIFIFALLVSLIAVLYFAVKVIKKYPYIVVIIALSAITAVLLCGYYMQKETLLALCIVAACATIGNIIACILFASGKALWNLYKHCGQIYGEIKTV